MKQRKVILFVRACDKMSLNKVLLLLPLYLKKIYGCEAAIYTVSKASDVPNNWRGVEIVECPDIVHRISLDHISCDLFICFGYGSLTPDLGVEFKKVNPNCITCFVTDHAADMSQTTGMVFRKRISVFFRRLFLLPLEIERFPKEKALGKKMCKAFDVFFTETESAYNDIVKHGWLHVDVSSKLLLLPMGYDDEVLPQIDALVNTPTERENIFLFTGIVGGDNKDHRLLLKAISKVKNWKDWKVVMDGPVRPWFKKAASSLLHKRPELAQRLDYSTNSPDRATLFHVYRKSKVFILTSDRESFCYSLVEASLLGDYILSTPVGIVPICTQNGKFGSLYQIGSASQLAHEMQAIIDGKIDLTRLAVKGQTCTRTVLSYSRIVSDFKLFHFLQNKNNQSSSD